jgi:hypothetical protein
VKDALGRPRRRLRRRHEGAHARSREGGAPREPLLVGARASSFEPRPCPIRGGRPAELPSGAAAAPEELTESPFKGKTGMIRILHASSTRSRA